MELVVIRHGETIDNQNRICQGQTEGMLNPKGESQAVNAGKILENEDFDAIYSSDLHRALQTANLIFQDRQNIVINRDKRLRERYFGEYEGHKIAENIDYYDDLEGVEPMADMYSRVESFLSEVKDLYKGKKVAVVSHGITIGVLTSICKEVDFKDVERPKNCSISRFNL